jgi:hypothetical protein
MSDLTIPASYMISVEVVAQEGLDPDALATEIEHQLGPEFEVHTSAGGMVLVEIGAVADCDDLLDAGVKYRKCSPIPPGSEALIWRDQEGTWGARVKHSDVWPTHRYQSAEGAIQGRDRMIAAEESYNSQGARRLMDAQRKISDAVSENRGALERAIGALRAQRNEVGSDADEDIEDVREILKALDAWGQAGQDEIDAIRIGQSSGEIPPDTDSLEDHGQELGSYDS